VELVVCVAKEEAEGLVFAVVEIVEAVEAVAVDAQQ